MNFDQNSMRNIQKPNAKAKNGRYALFSSSLLLLFQRNDGICCNFIWTDVWSGCFCPLFCLLCVRQTPSHKTRTNGLSFSQLYEGNIVLLSWCRVGCGILFQLCRLLCLPHLLIRTCILYFYHLIPLGCFGRYWNSWFFPSKEEWLIYIHSILDLVFCRNGNREKRALGATDINYVHTLNYMLVKDMYLFVTHKGGDNLLRSSFWVDFSTNRYQGLLWLRQNYINDRYNS